MECHKCKNKDCLNCKADEQYSFRYQHYILEGYNPQQPDTSGSQQVTDLSDETEDKFRKFLYDLFDLSDLELLMLKAIMNGKTLQQFADDMTLTLERQHKMMTKNAEQKFSRHHAFQLRKSMLKKLGDRFAAALLTMGQRKKLKTN